MENTENKELDGFYYGREIYFRGRRSELQKHEFFFEACSGFNIVARVKNQMGGKIYDCLVLTLSGRLLYTRPTKYVEQMHGNLITGGAWVRGQRKQENILRKFYKTEKGPSWENMIFLNPERKI